jgi:hypothetical protein
MLRPLYYRLDQARAEPAAHVQRVHVHLVEAGLVVPHFRQRKTHRLAAPVHRDPQPALFLRRFEQVVVRDAVAHPGGQVLLGKHRRRCLLETRYLAQLALRRGNDSVRLHKDSWRVSRAAGR